MFSIMSLSLFIEGGHVTIAHDALHTTIQYPLSLTMNQTPLSHGTFCIETACLIPPPASDIWWP